MPLPGVHHVFRDRFWQCRCPDQTSCEHMQSYKAFMVDHEAKQRLICRDDCPYCWPDKE